jgi:hypothetical protein
MMLNFEGYEDVPVHTQLALSRYIGQGVWPGSFVEAVLCGDLFRAVALADGYNADALVDITLYVIDRLPGESWGSAEHVAHWIETHYELEGV